MSIRLTSQETELADSLAADRDVAFIKQVKKNEKMEDKPCQSFKCVDSKKLFWDIQKE